MFYNRDHPLCWVMKTIIIWGGGGELMIIYFIAHESLFGGKENHIWTWGLYHEILGGGGGVWGEFCLSEVNLCAISAAIKIMHLAKWKAWREWQPWGTLRNRWMVELTFVWDSPCKSKLKPIPFISGWYDSSMRQIEHIISFGGAAQCTGPCWKLCQKVVMILSEHTHNN